MSSVKISLGVLQRVSELLAELPEEQLEALAEGRARLAYVPEGATAPAPARGPARQRSGGSRQEFTPSRATVDLLEHFETLGSREAATEALASLKKSGLSDIAKALSVPRASSLTLDQLRQEIVEATVGRRLDSIAIRGFDGPRP